VGSRARKAKAAASRADKPFMTAPRYDYSHVPTAELVDLMFWRRAWQFAVGVLWVLFMLGAVPECLNPRSRFGLREFVLAFVLWIVATIVILFVEQDKLGGRGVAAEAEYRRRLKRR
jgi:hypothetical protein